MKEESERAYRNELALSHAELWYRAINLYYMDAKTATRRNTVEDGGEALDDLRGSRELLSNLCEPVGLDVQAVGDEIEGRLRK